MGTTTTTYALNKPTVGGDENAWGADLNTNADKLDDLLDGTIAIKPNLDLGLWEVGGVAVTSTAAELNLLDGVTASTAELNILDGVTATASELNILDGATLTVTELNYVDGVTSAIQTQLDAKLSSIADGSVTFAKLAAAAVVTESETIAGNDNDTTIPTSAAVKAYTDGAVGFSYIGSQSVTSDATGIVTGLSAYRRIWVVGSDLDQALSGELRLRVGDIGGLISTAIYRNAEDGALQTSFQLCASTNGDRSFSLIIENFNTTDAAKPIMAVGNDFGPYPILIESATAFDRFGVFSTGGANNITSGTLYFWGA